MSSVLHNLPFPVGTVCVSVFQVDIANVESFHLFHQLGLYEISCYHLQTGPVYLKYDGFNQVLYSIICHKCNRQVTIFFTQSLLHSLTILSPTGADWSLSVVFRWVRNWSSSEDLLGQVLLTNLNLEFLITVRFSLLFAITSSSPVCARPRF